MLKSVFMKYPPTNTTGLSENFPKLPEECCSVIDTAADFCAAWFLLFRIAKLCFLASRTSSYIRRFQNLRPYLEAVNLMHMWAVCPRASQEVWDFLWNKFCTLGAAVRQESALQLGGMGQEVPVFMVGTLLLFLGLWGSGFTRINPVN